MGWCSRLKPGSDGKIYKLSTDFKLREIPHMSRKRKSQVKQLWVYSVWFAATRQNYYFIWRLEWIDSICVHLTGPNTSIYDRFKLHMGSALLMLMIIQRLTRIQPNIMLREGNTATTGQLGWFPQHLRNIRICVRFMDNQEGMSIQCKLLVLVIINLSIIGSHSWNVLRYYEGWFSLPIAFHDVSVQLWKVTNNLSQNGQLLSGV